MSERVRPLSRGEVFRMSLLIPGIPAVLLGVIFASLMYAVGALQGFDGAPVDFIAFKMPALAFYLAMIAVCFVLPPFVFIGQSYSMGRSMFGRCLDCGRRRVLKEVERLGMVERCGGCLHELPSAKAERQAAAIRRR